MLQFTAQKYLYGLLAFYNTLLRDGTVHYDWCYTMVEELTTLSYDKRRGLPVGNQLLASRENP